MMTTPLIQLLESVSLFRNRPYMLVGDMVKYPRLAKMPDYLNTREHFAVQLEYFAGVGVDEAYANQSIGIYGGMYVIVTEAAKGTFAQTTADDVMTVEKIDISILRKL